MPAGIYVHFPFCFSKCDYCSFYSVPAFDSSVLKRYFDALILDIDYHASLYFDKSFDTVYFGGGTPLTIGSPLLKKISEKIFSSFRIESGYEFTIECNPSSSSIEDFKMLSDSGCNRISLGVQSLDENVNRFLGRKYTSAENVLKLLNCTFLDVSADIIAGVSDIDKDSVLSDIDVLSDTNADHVSVYMLSVEEGTPLYLHFSDADKYDLHQKNVFESVIERLNFKKYSHYEVSNFARNGRISRHNMKYWTWQDYLGMGAASHSFIGGKRWHNTENYQAYSDDPLNVIVDERSESSAVAEYIMTGLRLAEGISISKMKKIFGDAIPPSFFERVKSAADSGRIEIKNGDVITAFNNYFYLNDTIYYLAEQLI
ncbi:MAG: radical SAM family heme chaperone HemW [Spirochaetes bacterium]|nr:radical SAM family heme chaperone HemW [Spirochaetota bacterium]